MPVLQEVLDSMIRSAIICSDQDLGARLAQLLPEIGGIGLVRALDTYPSAADVNRFVRAHAPQVVFLGVQSPDQAAAIAKALEASAPGIQIVAVHSSCDPQLLLELMRAGIREFLTFPFDRILVRECLGRVKENLDRKPVSVDSTDLVFSFLPSKPGVGTSTLAVNTAISLSRSSATKALLTDFDLNSGMIRFMLKLENGHSLVDAAEHAAEMDENLWSQLVTPVGSLDVLHAGKLNPSFRIEAQQVRGLMAFTRRNYKVICADLSGALELYSTEVMQESKRIFLVCTPEIPSLHLAREKYEYLRSMDLGERVSVLLNRHHKRSLLSPEQVEELVGLPVHMAFPNDYQSVHKALTAGKQVDASTELGRKCKALAESMLAKKPSATVEAKRRFVEYFSISPARYSLGGRN
ncbi:MAG: hypothetical protein ACRD7E_12065 [Bryobacteraceae bacterium]